MRHLLSRGTKPLSVMIIGLLIVSGMLTSSFLSARGAEDPTDRREMFRELPGKPQLVIELISADCIIATGEEGLIQLRVLYSHGEDRYQVEVRELGEEVRLQERFLGGSARGFANWQITVPPATEVLFSSVSGDLQSSGGYTGLEAGSASGAISVRDLQGRIDINTASAPVRLRNIAGELVVNTVSGEVELAGFDGRLELRTGSGDVELEGLVAEIEAATAAGRIWVYRSATGGNPAVRPLPHLRSRQGGARPERTRPCRNLRLLGPAVRRRNRVSRRLRPAGNFRSYRSDLPAQELQPRSLPAYNYPGHGHWFGQVEAVRVKKEQIGDEES